MRALRLIKPGHPLELQSIPVPVPGPKDVLIQVKAAGICHSDAHYRAGRSRVHPLPMTLGHEVAGEIAEVGAQVSNFKRGDRVCVHYLATCGECEYCQQGNEQFCVSCSMIGKYRDGGYSEFILMPARSVFRLPDEVPFTEGAIMMCSSATCLHALNKARLRPGESVAIFGVGGLGLSAIQLAKAMGAGNVYAVDIQPKKLALAEKLGALPVNAAQGDPVEQISQRTKRRGVDVALELIGLPATLRQSVQCLGIKGRAALVGITEEKFEVAPYFELLSKEAEIIGVSDHLAQELPLLLELARTRKLNLEPIITRTVPLEADPVNLTLDGLEEFSGDARVVIVP